MDMSLAIELFGYLGSVLVVVSMLMSSVVKLRIINMLGSVISGTYALIIGSFPLVLMNVCLIAINLYNLRKLLLTKQEYHLIKCSSADGAVGFFLDHYRTDIAVYYDYFDSLDVNTDLSYLIFCNGEPAGILLGNTQGEGSVNVILEYTTPAFRDCSIGKFLYASLPREGIHKITMDRCSEKHRPYLVRMGYAQENGRYIKELG